MANNFRVLWNSPGTLSELLCGTSFMFLAYPIKPWPFLALSDKTDFYLCSSTLLHNFFSSHGHPVCRTVACWHLNPFMILSSWKNFTFFLTEKFSCSSVQGTVTSHTFLVTDFTSTWKQVVLVPVALQLCFDFSEEAKLCFFLSDLHNFSPALDTVCHHFHWPFLSF